MADVKQLLLNLGTRLVERHGFKPSSLNGKELSEGTTEEIIRFLLWLDNTPQAREELEKMGYSFIRTVPSRKHLAV